MSRLRLGLKRVLWIVLAGILVSCNLPSKDPVITGVVLDGDCNVRVSYVDHADDGGYVFLRRMAGDNDDLSTVIIETVVTASGEQPSSFLDVNVPNGTYQYRLMVEKDDRLYSNFSSPVTINNDACSSFEHVQMPLNPFSPEVAIVNKCDIHVEVKMLGYGMSSGGRIYRESLTEPQKMILDEKIAYGDYLVPFVYDDKNLAPGTYVYQASMYTKGSPYSQDGETFGEKSQPVAIPVLGCSHVENLTISPVPVEMTPVQPIVNLSPVPEPCIWQANVNIFLRKGPNTTLYEKLTDVEKGKTLPIVGQSENGLFWVVEVQPGVNGYVTKSEKYSLVNGSCENIPALKDPAPPENAAPSGKTTATPQGLNIPILIKPFTATPRSPVP